MEWYNSGIPTLKHAICAQNVLCVPKIAVKQNNFQFYLPNFLQFFDNISQKLFRPSQFLERFLKIPEWSTLQK